MRSSWRVPPALLALTASLLMACGGSEEGASGTPSTAPGGEGAARGTTGGGAIGPEGGTLRAVGTRGETITLTVPAGALDEPVAISMEPLAEPDGYFGADLLYLTGARLEPEGTAFVVPATLTLQLPDGVDPAEAVARRIHGDAMEELSVEPGTDEVTVSLDGFSDQLVFRSVTSAVDLALRCGGETHRNLRTSEYYREDYAQRGATARIETIEGGAVYEYAEWWGDPAGRHLEILTLVEVDYTIDPPGYYERSRGRQYGSDGQLTYSWDQVDGEDVDATELDAVFGPGFATEPTELSGDQLEKALDDLRRSSCGYVEVTASQSVLGVGDVAGATAVVHDRTGTVVAEAAVDWSGIGGVEVSATGARQARLTGTRGGFATVTAVQQGDTSRRGSVVLSVLEAPQPSDATTTATAGPCSATVTGTDGTYDITLPGDTLGWSLVAFQPYGGLHQTGEASYRQMIHSASSFRVGTGGDREIDELLWFSWPLDLADSGYDHPNLVSAEMVNPDTARIEVELGADDGKLLYDERLAYNEDPDMAADEHTAYDLIYSDRPGIPATPFVAIVTFVTSSGDNYSIANTATQYLVVRGFDAPRVGPPWGPGFDTTSFADSHGTVIYGVTVDSPEGTPNPTHHVCPPLEW